MVQKIKVGTAAKAGLTTLALGALPRAALADGTMSGAEILRQVMGTVSGGVGFLGAALIVFGIVSLGTALFGEGGRSGSQLAGAGTALVGGAVIAGAALFFNQLDTSWLG